MRRHHGLDLSIKENKPDAPNEDIASLKKMQNVKNR